MLGKENGDMGDGRGGRGGHLRVLFYHPSVPQQARIDSLV